MEPKNLTDVVFKLSIDLGIALEGSPALKDVDVPQIQMRVLRFVQNHEAATPLAIADAIRRDKGHVTRLLRELQTDDLVKLVPNPADGRSKIVVLTEKSERIFAKIKEAEAPIFARAVDGIAPDALDQFLVVAERISKNLTGG